jgi:hypothetical protein
MFKEERSVLCERPGWIVVEPQNQVADKKKAYPRPFILFR